MNLSHDAFLMHAVLDGEATPEESAALSARLARDPEARAEFDRLTQLFARLAAVTPQHPPEGMVAAIAAQTPARTPAAGEWTAAGADQLFVAPRVFGSDAQDAAPGDELPLLHAESTVPISSSRFYFGKNAMSETNSLFANRKVLVGGGIAAAALVIGFALGHNAPPDAGDVAGTIVPAERYRAPQVATADIPLGDQSVSQLLQNDAFLKLIKDPQIQALVLEPDFASNAKAMLENPESARKALAGTSDAQVSASFRAVMAHPEAARMLLAYPEANRALVSHQDAAMAFIPQSQRTIAADRSTANQSTNANLSSANQSVNANLATVNQSVNANRVDANLATANQSVNANLVNANKSVEANLVNANQSVNANRVDANLVNANRVDANLVNANQSVNANLVNANKSVDANLVNANKLVNANRVDANLVNANKSVDANLVNANRSVDANLVNANKSVNANRVDMNKSVDANRSTNN